MNLSSIDKAWVDGIWNKISEKLEKNAVELQNIIPYSTTDGKYSDMSQTDVGWWTNGFFGGIMWLMYKETQKECFKIAAQNQAVCAAFIKIILKKVDFCSVMSLLCRADNHLEALCFGRSFLFFPGTGIHETHNLGAGFQSRNCDRRRRREPAAHIGISFRQVGDLNLHRAVCRQSRGSLPDIAGCGVPIQHERRLLPHLQIDRGGEHLDLRRQSWHRSHCGK